MATTVKNKNVERYEVDVSLPSIELVYGFLNFNNPPTEADHLLTPELVILGKPEPNKSSYDLDTQITVTATAKLTELDDYEGTSVQYYDRLNLGSYLRNVTPIRLDKQDAETTRDIWPLIKDRFGLGLTVEEIVDEPLTWDSEQGQVIRVVSDCYAWTGSVRVIMQPRIPSLDDIIVKKGINGLVFSGGDDRASAEVYSYSKDTNAVAAYMPQLEAGTMIDDPVIASLMTQCTEDTWTCDKTPSDFNLYNARVTFNDELGDRIPTREGFTHAIEIEIDEEYCLALSGVLVFYYRVDKETEE